MAGHDLIFKQARNPQTSPVDLVFGDEENLPQGVYEANVSGRITGLRGTVDVHALLQGDVTGRITGLRGTVDLKYDINVQRPLGNVVRSHYQDAARTSQPVLSRYEQADRRSNNVRTTWQQAGSAGRVVLSRYEQADHLRRVVLQRYEQAQRTSAAPVLSRYEQADSLRRVVLSRYEQALRTSNSPVHSRFEDATRLRARVLSTYQNATRISAPVLSGFGTARQWSRVLRSLYEEARNPYPGKSKPVVPPGPQPCYVPGLPADLLFVDPVDYSLPAELVFVCECPPVITPEPEPLYIIPKLDVYMSLHHIDAVLLPSLEKVTLKSADIEVDDDSFGWSLSASGAEHLLDQLAPVGGLPAQIRVTVDGISWVFAVERISRTRKFNEARASIEGRSVSALLGSPYSPKQSWLNDAGALTAQQIVAQALEFTGTTIDWRLNDWLVPAGVWSFTGTPLDAALRVAESVGAVLRSHKTAQELIFAPRYAAMPWEWATTAPTIEMPADIIVTDSLRPDPRPAYNAVFVSGMSPGSVRGHVRRTGLGGTLFADPVTDALITHEVAARERGRSILGAGGNKLFQDMSLPLLTGAGMPGLFEPGYLLRVNDVSEQWHGVVRSLRLSASETGGGAVVVRQSVSVERNP